MREHRFKAWDRTHNEWYMNGDVFHLEYSGKYGDFYFDNDHPHNMRDVELVWVESTGLHDKHGKEIWEGDRISFSVFDYNDHDTQYEGVIVYSGSRFMIWKSAEDEFYGSDGGFDLDWVLGQDDELEVIGSIYGEGE